MSRSRLGLEAERLGSRLGLGHEGLVSIPGQNKRGFPGPGFLKLGLESLVCDCVLNGNVCDL